MTKFRMRTVYGDNVGDSVSELHTPGSEHRLLSIIGTTGP